MEAKSEEGGEQQVDEEEEGFTDRLGCLGVVKAVVELGECFAIVPGGKWKGNGEVSGGMNFHDSWRGLGQDRVGVQPWRI